MTAPWTDAEAALDAVIAAVAVAPRGPERLFAFSKGAQSLRQFVREGFLNVADVADKLQETAEAYGMLDDHDQDAIQIAISAIGRDVLPINGAGAKAAWAQPISEPIAATQEGRSLISTCAASIEPECVEWLSPGRIAIGKHTSFGGDPGTGKSQLSIFYIAAITTGGPLHYNANNLITDGGSLWICNRYTQKRPGTCDDWTLVAKRGRDGKDADGRRA